MPDSARALNRFGLGARLGETIPADSRRWLSDQITQFIARPEQIATALATPQLIELLRDSRAEKQQLKAAAQASGADPKAMKQANRTAGLAAPYADLRGAYVAAIGIRTQVA